MTQSDAGGPVGQDLPATQKIVSRWDPSKVLFECTLPADLESGLAVRHALEMACNAGANLADAYLADANLTDANLTDAYLTDANLAGAYLAGANLRGANLTDANLADAHLAGANLADANLTDAYLAGAYLAGANLRGANLTDANLRGANLRGANLRGANLTDANLTDANLAGANLAGANLTDANLAGAYLMGANLTDANLAGANLAGANLADANGAELAIAKTRILPEGTLIGWKNCIGVIVKLSIPAEAKRSHAWGRKCRAEFADVLEVVGAEVAYTSDHGPKTAYRAGTRVVPDSFDEEWQNECSNGIHFYITRTEAENHG